MACSQELAAANGLPFLETSALKGKNVEDAFRKVLSSIYKSANAKLYDQDHGVEPELDGKKINLREWEDSQAPAYWTSSCCDVCARLLGGQAPSQRQKQV